MPALVQISHLDFAYGQSLVLKHVDLAIEPRTTLGIIGPNGGGKTTLLRLLLGLLKPTRGSISIDGLSPDRAIARGNIVGYLPQNSALPASFPLSVRQVVRLGLAGKTGLMRAPSRDDVTFAEQLIERVGIRELAEQPIAELSGGQMQRALIARALAARPKLLLLDEPTTGIDRAGQQRFVDFLKDIQREFPLTVILVSHDLRAVSAISDRIACLNLTVHYHDVPHNLPQELAHQMFSCDLEAMGLGGACGCDHETTHTKPGHSWLGNTGNTTSAVNAP
jgi:zinc transport system ATP-binding protein